MVSPRIIDRYWKPVVFAACLIPLMVLSLRVFELGPFRLGPNPIEDIQDELGIWGIRFIMLTLTVTPLRYLIRQVWPIRFRRMLGLFAFTYCSLHFLNYLIIDHRFDFDTIIEDITERQFITIGFAALLAMTPLAVTSTDNWRRKLGRNWVTLHKLVYGIGAAACWHFFSQVKKDPTEPLVYVVILTVLLGARVVHDASRSARATP
ncbi:MAG: sulfite oxidase heme-binding subunit YedZ [Gammaproteobacteria bacterium]